MKPIVSIITINFNNDISRTLDSILTLNTDPDSFEHIIIDNLSTNGSDEVIKKYISKSNHKITYAREKDTGRYNAMNKGIAKSNGSELIFLNAGDYFYDSESLNELIKVSGKYDIVYGNINVIYNNSESVYTPPDILNFKYFIESALPHQATIINKKLFKKYGLYDETLEIVADQNFFVKTICKYKCSYFHLNKTISTYFFNGISSDPKNLEKINSEKKKLIDSDFIVYKTYSIKGESIERITTFNTPILFNIFNRPGVTRTVFNQIRKIRPKYFYIAADGPREDRLGEDKICQKTRDIINKIDWDCEVKTMFRNVNFGCGHGMSQAITWFFENVEKGIILEDDCVPDQTFFTFCEKMLEMYKYDDRIMHINGSSFVIKENSDTSYYFSKYYHVWGWATWKRAWSKYDFSIKTLPVFQDKKEIENIYNQKSIQDFWMACFDRVYRKQIDTWDYQWVYTVLSNNGLSIMPYTNLVSNIGFGVEATHTHNEDDAASSRQTGKIVEIFHPKTIVPNLKNDEIIYTNTLGIDLDLGSNKQVTEIPNPLNPIFSFLGKIVENFAPSSRFAKKLYSRSISLPINKKLLSSILTFSIYIPILSVFILNNINNPNLWFDESGQFWISKGLNHFSNINSHPLGIIDVLKNNSRFNLDPGGYSVILHYWSMVSSNHIFLRLLSVMFFFIGIVLTIKISQIMSPLNKVANFSGLILLSSPLICQYVFELRPYSMEMLATIASIYAYYRVDYILGAKKHALSTGLLLGILLTSRYSSVFPITATLILITFSLIKNKLSRKRLINFSLFITPIIISSLLIFIFTTRFQNPSLSTPGYVSKLMLNSEFIRNTISNKESFLTILPFIIVSGLFVCSVFNSKLRKSLSLFKKYFVYAILLNSIVTLLSLFGKYPYGLIYRWDMAINTTLTLSWIPILLFITSNYFVQKNFLKTSIKLFSLIVLVYLSFIRASTIKYNKLDSIYDNFRKVDFTSDSKLLINVGAFPSVKYQFEYGPLRKYQYSPIYLDIKTFDHHGYSRTESINLENNIDSFDYITISHFDHSKSNFDSIIKPKNNWIDVTSSRHSELYKNIEK